MRVLILGCGYVGLRLAAELAHAGHEVFGARRAAPAEAMEAMRAAGVKPVAADVTDPGSLAALPGPFDWVVNCASSGHGGPEEYRRVYLEGARNVVAWLAAAPPKKLVYTSSTSVYAQDDGSVVKESSAAEGASETGRILREAEEVYLEAGRGGRVPVVVLRVAGIYGPDRGHLFQQYLRNEARIPGQGLRHLNMIHVEDVAGAVIAALKSGRPGEVYNVVDDEPVALVHFYRWLSETLGKWMPPFAPEAEAEDRKRGLTDKKVSNRRLKMELGYVFKHANFRKGYTAEILRLERAGGLNIEPEPR